MKRAATAFVALLFFAACSGETGPMGPSGPEGAQGPPGPPGPGATMHVATATVAGDGTAAVAFQGLQVESSVVSCWLAETAAGPWLHVGTDLDGPTCGAGNDGNDLVVLLLDGVPGWVFMVTAVTGG